MSEGMSKYAVKYGNRRRLDGGAVNPRPLPLYIDYVRGYFPPPNPRKDDFAGLLPHEKPNTIAKFRGGFTL